MTICALLGTKANTVDALAVLTVYVLTVFTRNTMDAEALLTWKTLGTGANTSRCVEPIVLPYGHTTRTLYSMWTHKPTGVCHTVP